MNFSVDGRNGRTILELVAADRPGLLSEVGKVFRTERAAINGAKITRPWANAPRRCSTSAMPKAARCKEEACQRLQESLVRALDRRDGIKG